jgi:hypothetical protein
MSKVQLNNIFPIYFFNYLFLSLDVIEQERADNEFDNDNFVIVTRQEQRATNAGSNIIKSSARLRKLFPRRSQRVKLMKRTVIYTNQV